MGCVVIGVLLGGVVYSLTMTHHEALSDDNLKVEVHQTSKDHKDRLKRLSVRDLADRGFDVDSLIFHSIDTPPSDHSVMQAVAQKSRVDIDTSITYQVSSLFSYLASTTYSSRKFLALAGRLRKPQHITIILFLQMHKRKFLTFISVLTASDTR